MTSSPGAAPATATDRPTAALLGRLPLPRRATAARRRLDPLELVRRHRAFTAVFAAGLVLRVLATIAYAPALEFYGDSYSYLAGARQMAPLGDRPWGYSALLLLLRPFGTIAVVPVLQHLVGLGLGVALYALLRRRGLPAWLGVLGAAPVLLDAYQIDIEQFVLTETLVDALLVAAVLVLLWPRRPGPVACGVGGFLLAAALLTRTATVGVAVVAGLYLLLRRVGRRRVALFCVGFAVPVLGYAGWFATARGEFGLSNSSGAFLYARVAQFADCSDITVTRVQAILCSPHPASERPGPNYYMWDKHSPRNRLRVPPAKRDAVLGDFAHKAILAQPGDYAKMVGGDVVHYFAPGRWVGQRDWPVGSWRFPNGSEQPDWHVSMPLKDFAGHTVQRSRNDALAAVLRGYQRQGFTEGPLLAAAVVLPLVAAARRRRGSARLRADGALLSLAGLSLLVLPSATSCFDYRYSLPTLVLLPPAAAFGIRQLMLWRREPDPARPAGASAGRHGWDGRSRPAGERAGRHGRANGSVPPLPRVAHPPPGRLRRVLRSPVRTR